MALTEAEKKKIEEEEAYRAKVREEKKSRGCSGCLVAILLLVGALAITLIAINPAEQLKRAEQSSITPTITTIIGKFLDHNYEVIYQEGGSKYVATFSPFLPSNDAILTGAMFTAMGEIYGKHNLTDLKPEFISLEGVNHVRFQGTDGYFYFLRGSLICFLERIISVRMKTKYIVAIIISIIIGA
jgi:hypothetical protein